MNSGIHLTHNAVLFSQTCERGQQLAWRGLAKTSTRVPPNCKFLVDDLNSPWVFAEKFDLIHTRCMTPAIKDWARYLSQAYE